MDIDYINQLIADGTLENLYRAGLISYRVFEWREIYLWVNTLMLEQGISQEKAVLKAQIHYDKSRTTIYKAVYFFQPNSNEGRV